MTIPPYVRYGYSGSKHTCTHTDVVHAILCGKCHRLERELVEQKSPPSPKNQEG